MPVDYARATRNRTPAQILYRVMSRALDHVHGPFTGDVQTMFWGLTSHHGISRGDVDPTGKPIIQFGHLWNTGGATHPSMYLRANGWFRLANLRGWESRFAVAKNTFLEWSWVYGHYHWYYDPLRAVSRNYRNGELTQRTVQRMYVPERLLLSPTWRDEGGWVKLRQNPADVLGWEIVHAEDAFAIHTGAATRTATDFEKFQSLRQRRYNRIQRQHEIHTGLRDPNGRLKKTHTERPEAVTELSTHFTVSVPARTTPLRRNEQEGLWVPNGCL